MQNPLTRSGITPLRANIYAFKNPEGVIVCPRCGIPFTSKERKIPRHSSDTGFSCTGQGMKTEH